MRLIHLLILALLALVPSTASARWIEARSPNFVVYSDGGEDSLRRSVQLLEDYDRLLRTLTGTTAPPSTSPLRVYLAGSAAKLSQVEPAPGGVLGFYRARVGGTAAFAARGDRPGMGGEEVLLHEYAHHFATRYYPAYYPAWYSEGFAEYVMTARFAGDRIEAGRYNPGRAITLLRGPLAAGGPNLLRSAWRPHSRTGRSVLRRELVDRALPLLRRRAAAGFDTLLRRSSPATPSNEATSKYSTHVV